MKKSLLFSVFVLFSLVVFAQGTDDITGVWWNDIKSSKIKIEKKAGKTYDCYVWLEGKDVLQLKGFVAGIRMLGRKSTWTRTTLRVISTKRQCEGNGE